MKLACLGFLACLSVLGSARSAAADELNQGFRSPPPAARPWVYWFPLSGNLTKEGITADLEAMQRVGIGGVLYMEVDQGAPKGPADFANPWWRELFSHALKEARRLGLELNMNNDAGWCGSGGPWITPELSMLIVVFSETFIDGGQAFDGPLPKPRANLDFYRDIAVLAMPAPAGDGVNLAGQDAKITTSGETLEAGKFRLARPDEKNPPYIQIELAEPAAVRAMQMTCSGDSFHRLKGRILVSSDGTKFQQAQSFHTKPPLVTATFDAATARFLRVEFTNMENIEPTHLDVSGIQVTASYRVKNIEGKASFIKQQFPPAAARHPTAPADMIIPRAKIEDISSKMDPDGKLSWKAPPGKWLVLRLGYTTTGKTNHPAPETGRGLECDKLNPEAAKRHFDNLMGKLIAENKTLSGQGKTLIATHIDSWELGSQNWTPKMREEFRRRRGYDLWLLLPAFTGRVVDSVEVTERFLWDLRQTVSEMIVENYAGTFRRLAHENGMRLSIEAYGEPAIDMHYASQADEPMGEFWSWNWLSGTRFDGGDSCAPMASAAHVYGKKIIGAEAFTANNGEMWRDHPANIKDLGDWAFCEGINRFVFHRYAAQPWLDRAPGMSMGPWGLHYERTQTWWEQSKAWHEYLARCQYLLQQGLHVADILHLQPEGSPWGMSPLPGADVGPHIRGGYNHDGCTADALLTRVSVKDGRLSLPDGMSYRVLVLPAVETMTLPLLRKIKELADAGATIVGDAKPPQRSPSLAEMGEGDGEVERVAAGLWSSGKIVTGRTAQQVLAVLGIKPDFSATPMLRYVHRTLGDAECYFVANPEPIRVNAIASFRVTGKRPELWWPDSGRTAPCESFVQKKSLTEVPLHLEPYGSVFVVFRKSADGVDPIVSVARDGLPVAPAVDQPTKIVITKARYGLLDDPAHCRDVREEVQAMVDAGTVSFRINEVGKGLELLRGVNQSFDLEYTVDGKPFSFLGRDADFLALKAAVAPPRPPVDIARGEIRQSGDYVFKTAAGRELRQTATLGAPREIPGPWFVAFDPKWGGPAKITFDKLEDWSKHSDPGIKYYSGTAIYHGQFNIADPPARAYLDLGKVAVMAAVKLNGKDLGILWKPPYEVDVSGVLKAGENRLEIKVVNLWANRQIGDEQLPEDSDRNPNGTLKQWPKWLLDGKPSPTGRLAFTTWRLWKKSDAPLESGLIGPVTLQTIERLQPK